MFDSTGDERKIEWAGCRLGKPMESVAFCDKRCSRNVNYIPRERSRDSKGGQGCRGSFAFKLATPAL